MKRGQTTLFIVVAVIIVAIIGILIFFMNKNADDIPGSSGNAENAYGFLSSCIEDSLKETIKTISEQGGYVEPHLYRALEGENISYLCYTQNYYVTCVNQEPVLIQHLKSEIKENIKDDVEECMFNLKLDYERKGYDVNLDYNDFEVSIVPGKTVLDIDATMSYSKGDENEVRSKFDMIVPTKFYDLAIVVQEILAQEARFCNFEQQGYMLLYNEYDIDRFRLGDATIIYTVKHRKSGEEFKFAVRSCAIPPGF